MNALTAGRERWTRLFGLDLAPVVDAWRDGWHEALRWRAVRWLLPATTVRVIDGDGRQELRRGVSNERADAGDAPASVALELPEDDVLRRRLALPPMRPHDVQEAVLLDVHAASPFPAEELVHGFQSSRSDSGVVVHVALTSRAIVQRRIDSLREHLGAGVPEVWVGGSPPIVLPGYGEQARRDQERHRRRPVLVLAAIGVLLGSAIVAVFLVQQSQAVTQAEALTAELGRAAAPQLAKRERLAQATSQLNALATAARERTDVLHLLEDLTRKLPDDTALSQLEFTGGRVRLTGQSDNAARLLQTLGSDAAYRDVRAPQAIARSAGGGKDSFVIDLGVASAPRAR